MTAIGNAPVRQAGCSSAKLAFALLLSFMLLIPGQPVRAEDLDLRLRAANEGLAALETEPWTVITVAPDGAWGVGIDNSGTAALSKAVANCRAMTDQRLGCGARIARIRRGWSMVMKCGDEYIIAAAAAQMEAVQRLWERAREIRATYNGHLPGCRPMLTVDPLGSITVYERRNFQGLTYGD